MVPILPCADLDPVLRFYLSLGFHQTYRQDRPYPCFGVSRGDGWDLQFGGIESFDPESNWSSVIIPVADTGALYQEFAAGLRAEYGKLPLSGFPRITRPRRKQGMTAGFSVIDPAGNWLRIAAGEEDSGDGSRLERVLLNAAQQGDSRGDVGAAITVLESGLRRHSGASDQERLPLLSYLSELLVRQGANDKARTVLNQIDGLSADPTEVTAELAEVRAQLSVPEPGPVVDDHEGRRDRAILPGSDLPPSHY